MIFITSLSIICILCVLISKLIFPKQVQWIEVLAVSIISLIFCSLFYVIALNTQLMDEQVISGKVTSKEHVYSPRTVYYSCNCRMRYVSSGSGKYRRSGMCRVCSTCHKIIPEWDWVVKSTVGNFTIDRVDTVGKIPPKRYTDINVNDPVSKIINYENYMKVNSVYSRKYSEVVPSYPSKIYDYYKIDRVVNQANLPKELTNKLNTEISNSLVDLGKSKEVNIVVFLTDKSQSYVQSIKAAWLGGKKNDLIVVIGTDINDASIKWVESFGWSKSSMVYISIRDDLMSYGKIDERTVRLIAQNIEKYWERSPMKKLDYLKAELNITDTSTKVISVLVLLICFAGITISVKNDY